MTMQNFKETSRALRALADVLEDYDESRDEVNTFYASRFSMQTADLEDYEALKQALGEWSRSMKEEENTYLHFGNSHLYDVPLGITITSTTARPETRHDRIEKLRAELRDLEGGER